MAYCSSRRIAALLRSACCVPAFASNCSLLQLELDQQSTVGLEGLIFFFNRLAGDSSLGFMFDRLFRP